MLKKLIIIGSLQIAGQGFTKQKETSQALVLKKANFFYLDLSDVGAQGHYGDHIEIFNSNKIACEVRNLDGTKDYFKTKVALNLIDNDGKARPIDEQLPIDIIDGSLKSKFYENNGCEDCINDFKI